MSLNNRLTRLEKGAADRTDETDLIILELGPGWSVEIPAKTAPDLFQRILKIYGRDGDPGERVAA